MKIKVKHNEESRTYGVYMYCVGKEESSIVPIKYFYYNEKDQEQRWQECLKYAKYIEDQIKYRQKDV